MNTIIIDGLSFALPLFIMAIGGIYCERSGVTNLAIEGLQGFGAFCGALFAVCIAPYFAGDSPVPFYLAMVFAFLGGTLFSLLHAMLCIRFKANQVISGVVINKFVLGVSARVTVPGISSVPVLGAVFTNLYPFEPVIALIAVIAWYVLYRTPFGLHLRACGDNPHAVDAAGIEVGKVRLIAVLVSGALSGLGGICFAYSISANFSSNIYSGYGYLAIAALIFGNWKILPTLGACLLFGFARSGGYELVKILEMPSSYQDLVMVLPYVLTLLMLVFFGRKNHSPRALGVIYDKGAR